MGSGWRELGHANSERYRVHLAETDFDVYEAQRLRFEVFNLEQGEGLATAQRWDATKTISTPYVIICWSGTRPLRKSLAPTGCRPVKWHEPTSVSIARANST